MPLPPLGSRRTLTGAVKPTLPVGVDPLDVPGTMLLVDMAHSTMPGVREDLAALAANTALPMPASGYLLTNIAAVRAAAMGIAGETRPALTYPAAFTNTVAPVRGKIERTNKGGIHIIASQANPLPGNTFASIAIPDNIATFILNNPAHSYAIAIWDRVTRGLPSGATAATSFSALASNSLPAGPGVYTMLNTAGQVGGVAGSGDFPFSSTGKRLLRYRSDDGQPNTFTGARLTMLVVAGWYGTPTLPTGTAKNRGQALYVVGPANPFGGNGNVEPSGIFNRGWIHDLTVSGFTPDALLALELARYTREVLTAPDGTPLRGRRQTATFTDPATIP